MCYEKILLPSHLQLTNLVKMRKTATHQVQTTCGLNSRRQQLRRPVRVPFSLYIARRQRVSHEAPETPRSVRRRLSARQRT